MTFLLIEFAVARPVPIPPVASSPDTARFTDARRRESGSRVRRVRGVAADLETQIDTQADAQSEAEEMLEAIEATTTTDESLEARLLYETRAAAERRLAVAGDEDIKATRRVHVNDRLDRTLMGMPPVTIPCEPIVETKPAPIGAITTATARRAAAARRYRWTALRVLTCIGVAALIGVVALVVRAFVFG